MEWDRLREMSREEPWVPYPKYIPSDCHTSHTTGDFLCQFNPPESTGGFYPDDSPTESIEGFLNDGGKHRAFIIESCKLTHRTFQWLVTVNYEVVLSIDEINEEWGTFTKRTSRLANKGLALFWVREITRTDPRRLHYHMGILEGFSNDIDEVRRVMDKCLSDFSKNHVRVEAPDNPYAIPAYILKLEPHHRDKIILFRPKLGLKRVGHLGHFGPEGMRKKDVLGRAKEKKDRVKAGCKHVWVPDIANHISTFLGMPFKKIRDLIGENPYDPVWEKWEDGMWERRHSPAPLNRQTNREDRDFEDPFFINDEVGTPANRCLTPRQGDNRQYMSQPG